MSPSESLLGSRPSILVVDGRVTMTRRQRGSLGRSQPVTASFHGGEALSKVLRRGDRLACWHGGTAEIGLSVRIEVCAVAGQRMAPAAQSAPCGREDSSTNPWLVPASADAKRLPETRRDGSRRIPVRPGGRTGAGRPATEFRGYPAGANSWKSKASTCTQGGVAERIDDRWDAPS